ncbi:MAG TPA: hypothetical protein VK528_13945 [Flavobacterium sp.]|nr:hypothetical protein [Flavobacterium sp.]
MKTYKNLSGNSGIKAYELLDDGLKIQFVDDSVYLYNVAFNGENVIKIMKALARKGIGLTTYINQEVRENFAAKLQ